MDWEHAAGGFAAMGSEARLAVLRCLVRAGEGGLMVQDIQARTGIAPSTLAHHLKLLAGAELIVQRREGRSTYNTADYAQLQRLAAFILSECCADAPPEQEAANDG